MATLPHITKKQLFRQVLAFGIIHVLYPATRWILAVIEFGTISSPMGGRH